LTRHIVSSIKLDHPYAPKHPLEDELQLPDLDAFQFGPLPDLESLDQSSFSVDAPPLAEEEDIWQVAVDSGPANKDISLFTWEAFENPVYKQPTTPYITETGSGAYDAALAKDDGLPGKVIRQGILLDSLWNLGLGRSSILFSWDARLRTFVAALPDVPASGLSLPSARSVIAQFIMTGNTFLYLRSFSERTFASTDSIPARVALATCVASILSTFEDHLGRHSNTVESLLQLQSLFTKPQGILVHIARMVDAVKAAKSNEELASIFHHRVLELEGDDYLRKLFSGILCRVSEPSLDLIGEWIGIQNEQDAVPLANRGSFVFVEDQADDQGPIEYGYNAGMMPRFITPEDGNTIFETGNSLRFIKTHHPAHPLASLEKHSIQPPELEWKIEWEDIETISAKAKAYEESLRAAIQALSRGLPSSTVPSTRSAEVLTRQDGRDPIPSEADFHKQIEESAQLFDAAPGSNLRSLPDELQLLAADLLTNTAGREAHQYFSPPLSMTSTLSFRPLLTAQAKLVNATTLRLFFRSHQLRMHLSLQRQYHLFGDGVFSSRLASALFDPERESAERHKGTMRSGVHMGLQVGSRDAWPPASSELRLALMGVLSESFYSSALYHSTLAKDAPSVWQGLRDQDELPGQLNFAVRQLTETEMEKIMDPDSLFALDFLRLQYVPPSPLNLVISTASLEKYDYIFKFLLRLLRMLFVISHLPRSYSDVASRYFRMEAYHFVTAISSYIFQTGIAEHWDTFESHISSIETRLADEDAAGELGRRVTSGLENLKAAHEQCLDSIMFSLLLRRRQKKVMALLEEIFEHILLFAKIQRDAEDGKRVEVKELYSKLKGKIRVFISVCRGLTGKRGYGKGKGTGEENTLERLGVLLEMNGYFAG
jgi:hypothetical protein